MTRSWFDIVCTLLKMSIQNQFIADNVEEMDQFIKERLQDKVGPDLKSTRYTIQSKGSACPMISPKSSTITREASLTTLRRSSDNVETY